MYVGHSSIGSEDKDDESNMILSSKYLSVEEYSFEKLANKLRDLCAAKYNIILDANYAGKGKDVIRSVMDQSPLKHQQLSILTSTDVQKMAFDVGIKALDSLIYWSQYLFGLLDCYGRTGFTENGNSSWLNCHYYAAWSAQNVRRLNPTKNLASLYSLQCPAASLSGSEVIEQPGN